MESSCQSREGLEAEIPQASAEALAAFGDGGLYLERFVPRARHVEVQVLGDGEATIHLYERECSLQRRRQKVAEQAPAICLSPERREALCASAVRLAKSVGYRGAGTLEYLYDEATDDFYFIEMNTRIQVEHPVTEMITGVDLVQSMLLIAGGTRSPTASPTSPFAAMRSRSGSTPRTRQGIHPADRPRRSLSRARGRGRPFRHDAV